MNNLTKLIANYWVLAIGSDCDGYNRGSVTPFAYENDAVEYADGQNEWSDGIRYYVTSSLDVLRDYCADYNMDWMNYLHECTPAEKPIHRFSIDGYWKDDKSEFYGYIVSSTDDVGDDDDDIFFYGISEATIIDVLGRENTGFDFVITSYSKVR